MLKVKSLTYAVQNRDILKHLSFDLKSGEIMAVVGPNGAGKSSLIQCLTHPLPALQGRIEWWGQSWSPQRHLARAQQLGVLPQQTALHFDFTVKDVVALGRLPHACAPDVHQACIHQALLSMNLIPLMHQPYTQLSGGEQQRVHIARVFCQIWPIDSGRSTALILDEPYNSLDLKYHTLLTQQLRVFATQGVGILVVLHDLLTAVAVADRCMVLNKGECVDLGPPIEILTPDLIHYVYGVHYQLSPLQKKWLAVCDNMSQHNS